MTGIPITFPHNTYPINCPWEITGKVKNGKMSISFLNNKLKLNSEYENDFTDGVRIGNISIQQKNNRSLHIGLHKINTDVSYNEIDILYLSDDLHKPNLDFYGDISLKAGWNFIEIIDNPDWFYGSDEEPYLVGLVSQNINDFLNKGYRWQIEYWK